MAFRPPAAGELRIISAKTEGITPGFVVEDSTGERYLLATTQPHQLMEGRSSELWNGIDTVVRSFVGESDSMTVPEVASLVTDLGGLDAARQATDTAVASAISAGGYGEQQIASHLMVNDGIVKTLPLSRSFLVFGQRYVVDSHVFSEVVYDRLEAMRMMPSVPAIVPRRVWCTISTIVFTPSPSAPISRCARMSRGCW